MILLGTVEAVILVVLLAIFSSYAALFLAWVYIVVFGPSLICAIAGLVLGMKNRWLRVALALLVAAFFSIRHIKSYRRRFNLSWPGDVGKIGETRHWRVHRLAGGLVKTVKIVILLRRLRVGTLCFV